MLVTALDGSPKRLDELTAHPTAMPRLEGAEFVEPIRPRDRLVLFGAGHVCRAIAPLAAGVGFEVVICDDGETGALTTPPPASQVIDSFDLRDVERALGPLGVGDYIVIVTRDHAVDQAILERALPNLTLSYLGVIGSLGKIGRFKKRLEAKRIATPERWQRLSAPIGIDIAAETPEEIAVSVVAELIQVRNIGRVRGP
jgi:xanthine dehydrogenase accessory factor